ncbi:hypothetical protein EZ449_15835 [Pedobacter frigidisoli]|uniref:Activator of Hsp90 ATPase homologue 1/2-like C-terminal domain-containing protein n=1 Tax=Pedobacter frigidisoli TaxID=2530455 RepID=A0A4R0NWV1_9SPHI|nr:hypothetical protein EZ449_15835 [Pedobacter frigidisoli]
MSGLSDETKHYSVITFLLHQAGKGTRLTLLLRNFPTESIYRHMNLYWKGTLVHLKAFIESGLATSR